MGKTVDRRGGFCQKRWHANDATQRKQARGRARDHRRRVDRRRTGPQRALESASPPLKTNGDEHRSARIRVCAVYSGAANCLGGMRRRGRVRRSAFERQPAQAARPKCLRSIRRGARSSTASRPISSAQAAMSMRPDSRFQLRARAHGQPPQAANDKTGCGRLCTRSGSKASPRTTPQHSCGTDQTR